VGKKRSKRRKEPANKEELVACQNLGVNARGLEGMVLKKRGRGEWLQEWVLSSKGGGLGKKRRGDHPIVIGTGMAQTERVDGKRGPFHGEGAGASRRPLFAKGWGS